MQANRGFTLVELMVTVAVLAIISSIAFPNMRELIVNGRITTQTNELISSLSLARSEAIQRGLDVSVCAADGTGLASGWFIVAGADCAAAVPRLVRHEALSDLGVTGDVAALRFSSRGGLIGGEMTLTLTPTVCPAGSERARQISILGSGRVAVVRKSC